MKYNIDWYGVLIIRNEKGDQIFGINKNNMWFKSDYDHKGEDIYYQDHRGIELK